MKEKTEYQKVFKSILKEAKNKRALNKINTKQLAICQTMLKKNFERQNQG